MGLFWLFGKPARMIQCNLEENNFGFWAITDRCGNVIRLSDEQKIRDFIKMGLKANPDDHRSISRMLEKGQTEVDLDYWLELLRQDSFFCLHLDDQSPERRDAEIKQVAELLVQRS